MWKFHCRLLRCRLLRSIAWANGASIMLAIIFFGTAPALSAQEFYLGESTGNSRLSDKPTKFFDVTNEGVPEPLPFSSKLAIPSFTRAI